MVQSIAKLVAFTSNILVCILIGKMVLPKRKNITISEMARNILKERIYQTIFKKKVICTISTLQNSNKGWNHIGILWTVEDKDYTKNIAENIKRSHEDKFSQAPNDEEASNNKGWR